MPTATIASVLMFLAMGSTPPGEIVPMNSRNFKIPISIKGGQREKIKELLLFVSRDQGQTYSQVAATTPDKDSFEFFAPADGVYWFSICVVDSNGNREPKDLYKSAPGQKVLVDTMKPSVRLTSATRRGEDIVVSWEIDEENPDLNTFKLEYQAADSPPQFMWYGAPVPAAMKGEGKFRFGPGPLQVRLTMADQAGNVGAAQAQVPALTPAPTMASSTPLAVPPPSPAPSIVTPPAFSPMVAGNSVASVPAQSAPANLAMSPPPSQVATPAVIPQVVASNFSGTNYPAVNYSPQPAPMQNEPRPMERPWTPSQPYALQQANAYIPESGPRYAPAPPASSWPYQNQPYSNARSGSNLMIPTRITNQSHVALDYQITRAGPSGVGSVEMYVTEDDGQSWRRLADAAPPGAAQTTSSLSFNLPEGSYGLRMVVGSRAGLGRRPPKPGDYPQMRLEVDTTPPVVRMLPLQPDPNRRNALLISWTASDKNLAPSPITLEWADRSNGPWHEIATDLVHSGRYTWTITPDVPPQVYLKVSAKDTAGNLGSDETPEPVLVDLQEPEAQIIGLSASARRP